MMIVMMKALLVGSLTMVAAKDGKKQGLFLMKNCTKLLPLANILMMTASFFKLAKFEDDMMLWCNITVETKFEIY